MHIDIQTNMEDVNVTVSVGRGGGSARLVCPGVRGMWKNHLSDLELSEYILKMTGS